MQPPPLANYGSAGSYTAHNSYAPPQQQQGPPKQPEFQQQQQQQQPPPGHGDQMAAQMSNLRVSGGQPGPAPGAPQMNGMNHGPLKQPQQYPNGQPGYYSPSMPPGQQQYRPPPGQQQGPPQMSQSAQSNGLMHNGPSVDHRQMAPSPIGMPPMGQQQQQQQQTGAGYMGPPQTGGPSSVGGHSQMGPPPLGGPPQMGQPPLSRPPMGPPPPGGPAQIGLPSSGGPSQFGGPSQPGGHSSVGPSQASPLSPMGSFHPSSSSQMGPPPMSGSTAGPPAAGSHPPSSVGAPPVGPPMGHGNNQFAVPPGPPMTPSSAPLTQVGPPPMGNAMAPGQPGTTMGGSSGAPNLRTPAGGMAPNAHGPPMSGPHSSIPPMTNQGGGPPLRPPPMNQQQSPPNVMMPPMSSPSRGPPMQNGVPNSANSAFQPPPQGGYQEQSYQTGSPASPPSGPYPPSQPPQIGQGFAQPPPPMFGQTNGQYPTQAVQQQQPYPGQPPQLGGSGYPGPPTGGYPQAGYPGGQQRPPMQSPPQQRKLDPDQMPSPVQVIEDDRKNHDTGPFGTSKMGVLPPLVTTDIEILDEGNAGPNYIRSTVYSVPCSPDVSKQTQVPLALAITPFARHAGADGALPVSEFNDEIVRCNRCRAYMCPFMQFMDGGRRFQCVFCKATSEVPQGYFNHLDHMGMRIDKWQRAELCLGSYEIRATKEYCKNNVFPQPPAFIFVLDVSYNAIKCGMVELFCHNIKEILQELPTEEGSQEESGIRVGFITYSSQVHFYNIDKRLSQPQMMVVPDVADMFVPFLEGCLVKPSEAMHVIESLGQEIPRMFADTRETETILGPAIQAGLEALKATECAGKLFVFHTTLPTAEAPGKLKNRDDRKLLGTDKEKTVLAPGCPYYQELATQCVAAGCSIDLFVVHNAFVDLASIGQVAKITGGQVYKYTYFQSEVDGERFLADLRSDVSKPIAFDAVMRVRTSTGIRPTDFYGNLYMQNTTDVELASIDCDKCITVELKYDDKLPENECAFVQVALLYTSVTGQRKLRLHNLCLQTTQQMADMFRNCELDVIMNLFCKQALRQLLETSPKNVRESAMLRAATILASYRKNCATASSSGQLILPECMKLLPLYVNCMTKCDALSGGPELTVDDRAFGMLSLNAMDVRASQVYLYPRLLPVHDLDPADETDSVPVATRASVEKLKEDGAYLLANGMLMFLYVGLQVDPSWCEGVFGVSSPAKINVEHGAPRLNTALSRRLYRLIDALRAETPRFMRLYLVRQGDKLELVLRQFLVEDRMSDVQPSYVDYLCHLHREIRNLIS